MADAAYDGIGFTRSQLQHAFKHAKDFGVVGNQSNKTLSQFSSAIQAHIDDVGTQMIRGTYRTMDATHYVNPSTRLNVIQDSSGEFLSGWRLSEKQLKHLLSDGSLGGG